MTNQLKDRDYTLIIDKSGSMATNDTTSGTRWKAAQEATLGLANKINEFDPDGITVYPFSSNFKRYDNVTPEKVSQVFAENEPNGGTDLARVLKDALANFFTRRAAGQTKANGETILIVTDGTPDNGPAVAHEIIEASKKLTRDEELAIGFVQVGKDTAATAYLKSLDDDLQKQGAKFDIVDAITIEEMGEMNLSDMLLKVITD